MFLMPMTRVLKFTIAYDGTDYVGWQRQKNGPGVQAVVERAWQRIAGEVVTPLPVGERTAACMRLGQVVCIATQSELSPDVLLRAMNTYLPQDVVVLQAEEAPADFDPIRHAKRKRYRYVIQDGRILDVIARRYSWFIPETLDVDAMREAAQCLLGTHDFVSFQSAGSERATTIRTVFDVSVERGRGPLLDNIAFEIQADGFLYNMVRAIVGSLAKVGRRAHPPAWMREILEARDRTVAGPTAPPQGLFLVSVEYGEPARGEPPA